MQSMGIFVINLEKSTDRLQQVWPLLSKLELPLYRVDAIHGGSLVAWESLVDQHAHRQYFGKTMGLGTLGCALSHCKAWEAFLESSHEFSMICEDDIEFDPDQMTSLLPLLLKDKDLWDICGLQLNHGGAPVVIKKYPQVPCRLVSYLFPVTGGGCYVLNRKAAEALKVAALPVRWPVDHYYTRPWGMGLAFVGIEPRPVVQRQGVSEIDVISRYQKEIASMKDSLIRGWRVTQRSVRTVIYGLYIWIKCWLQQKAFKR